MGADSSYGHETALTSAGSGTTGQSVQSTLPGLIPGTTYHFRIIAIYSGTGIVLGSDESFATTGSAPAPSAAPTATTGGSSGIGQAGATLNGSVNPEGQDTSYWFEYGTTSDYGFQTGPVDAGSGTGNVSATTTLSSLSSGTTYHYRLVSVSAGGTTLGADQTFTTTTPPAVTTGAATNVGSSSVVFNGTVDPEAQDSTYYFQYGATTAYGLQTVPADAGSGSAPVAVNAYVAGLLPSTAYHFRLVSTNAGGISTVPTRRSRRPARRSSTPLSR